MDPGAGVLPDDNRISLLLPGRQIACPAVVCRPRMEHMAEMNINGS